MAKEHIELLNYVNSELDAADTMFHVYICSSLDAAKYIARLDSTTHRAAADDIKIAIRQIFRSLALGIGKGTWAEYGIAAMFEKPWECATANAFRLEVIEALLEDFEDAEVGCLADYS